MRNIILAATAFFFLSALPSTAGPGWKVHTLGRTRSLDGTCSFSIQRWSGKPLYAVFATDGNVKGIFDKSFPSIMIDRGTVLHITNFPDRRIMKKGTQVRWRVDKGKGAEFFKQLTKGNELTVQYFLPDGTVREAVFNLSGLEEIVPALKNNENIADHKNM